MVPSQLNSRKRGLLIQGWHYTSKQNFLTICESWWILNPVDAVGEFRFLDSVAIWDVARSVLSVLGRQCEGCWVFIHKKKTKNCIFSKRINLLLFNGDWLLLGYNIYICIFLKWISVLQRGLFQLVLKPPPLERSHLLVWWSKLKNLMNWEMFETGWVETKG